MRNDRVINTLQKNRQELLSLARAVVLMVGWLFGPSTLSAQGLAGRWLNPTYEVELTVVGDQVSGSFQMSDYPNAESGRISGELRADGTLFVADWTAPVGEGESRFSTVLSLMKDGQVLSGQRWTSGRYPSTFVLRRETSLGADDVDIALEPPNDPSPAPPDASLPPATKPTAVEPPATQPETAQPAPTQPAPTQSESASGLPAAPTSLPPSARPEPTKPTGTGPLGLETSPTSQPIVGMTLRSGFRQAETGEMVTVPVWLLNGKGLIDLNFNVEYDPAVVEPVSNVVRGNLLPGADFEANTARSGVVQLGLVPRSGGVGADEGTVAQLSFRAIGDPGTRSPLRIVPRKGTVAGGVAANPNTIHGEILIVGADGFIPGDINGDRKVDMSDVLQALKISVELLPHNPRADVDGDGQVTAADARIIREIVLGKRSP